MKTWAQNGNKRENTEAQRREWDWYTHAWRFNVYNCHTCTHNHAHALTPKPQNFRTNTSKTLDQILYTHVVSLSLSGSRSHMQMSPFITQHINSEINITITKRHRNWQANTHSWAGYIRLLTCYKFSYSTDSTNEHSINDNDLKEIKIPMSKSHHLSERKHSFIHIHNRSFFTFT